MRDLIYTARIPRKENKRFALTPKIFRKCELKIDLLTEVLCELVKVFVARIQFTGGPDKHSMSQSGRIYRFDSSTSTVLH